MPIRYLINNGGKPFAKEELQALKIELDALLDEKRTQFRNHNAEAIANHVSTKILIVSGPGTGKSTLFKNRISYWLDQDSASKILCLTFVRKLVADLCNEIQADENLTQVQKEQISVHTLHKFARSIVEKNHGTDEWRFQPHFRIIGQYWKIIVWGDILAFYPELDRSVYSWKKFEEQLHNNNFDESVEWHGLRDIYFKLCRFFNAAGFADLILRAKDALTENPELNQNNYFIIDEYQDFNSAENALINQLVNSLKGLLVVGDDEQVLYEELKSSKKTLIRDLYENTEYTNGMLPFCSRSSCHITKTAGHFIKRNQEAESIEKIYLPIKAADDQPKVQIIACATASTAVDYIEKFVEDNKVVINERREQLIKGEKKDAFLLILTPRKIEKFYVDSRFNGKEKIESFVSEYKTENNNFSDDYYRVLSYYSLANNPQNNLTFRKVLYYENIAEARVNRLIKIAMKNNKSFYELNIEEVNSTKQKCNEIKTILEEDGPLIDQKIESIAKCIYLADKSRLITDIQRKSINQQETLEVELQEEEDAELEEIEIKKMGAIELMTIVGSKGLSADHVILIGFDDVNMSHLTRNAFFVGMTRARKSLHMITALASGGAQKPHTFVSELPEQNVEFFKYTKTNRQKSSLESLADFNQYIDSLNYNRNRR